MSSSRRKGRGFVYMIYMLIVKILLSYSCSLGTASSHTLGGRHVSSSKSLEKINFMENKLTHNVACKRTNRRGKVSSCDKTFVNQPNLVQKIRITGLSTRNSLYISAQAQHTLLRGTPSFGYQSALIMKDGKNPFLPRSPGLGRTRRRV